MQIAELIECNKLVLVEQSFSDLAYVGTDRPIKDISSTNGKILIDEADNPLLFALEDDRKIWHGITSHLRCPDTAIIERFEDLDCEIYQENRDLFSTAVRKYYSENLVATNQPVMEDHNPERDKIVEGLISSIDKDLDGCTCLDCCCGSGIGSYLLEKNGYKPLACDNDASLLALGLKTGRLQPENTMLLDARLLMHYLDEPLPLTCGFMFGEIQKYNNEDTWHEIVAAVCKVSDRILLTVGTEPEADLIVSWVEEAGKSAKASMHDDDPIYDHFVVTGR